MNIVVSDTTALIILAKADTLNLLSNLFSNIYIPKAVFEELNFKDDIVKYRVNKFDIIQLKEISNIDILNTIKKFNIDKGEIEAITLALELKSMLIIDEKKGRKIALQQNLKIVGILGILIQNYRLDFINLEDVKYYFTLFKNNGLRVNQTLENQFFTMLIDI